VTASEKPVYGVVRGFEEKPCKRKCLDGIFAGRVAYRGEAEEPNFSASVF